MLETPRLILRDMQEEDAAAFSSYNENPEYYRYLFGVCGRDGTLKFVQECVAGNAILPRRNWYFTVLEKETSQVIGDISLCASKKYPDAVAGIGYGLDPAFWGKGLMSEALNAVTVFGHDVLGFHRLEADADAENIGSWRAMEKCGFVREASSAYKIKNNSGWRAMTYYYASVRTELIR